MNPVNRRDARLQHGASEPLDRVGHRADHDVRGLLDARQNRRVTEVAVPGPELVVLRDWDVLSQRRQLDGDPLARRCLADLRLGVVRTERRDVDQTGRPLDEPGHDVGDLPVGQVVRQRAAAGLVVGETRPGVARESGRVDDVSPECHDSDPSQM
jgi:hypothetical protein